MLSVLKQIRRVGLAVVALGSIAVSGQVFAQNTASGTSISNTATVNYSVNSVNQTPVSASTSFLVDTVINLNVTGGVTYNVPSNALAQVATYTVTNTSNTPSNFTLVVSDETAAANDFDMNNLVIHVDNGDGLYNAVDDTATSITGLARGASRLVFVTGDVPAGALNNEDAPVRLTATAINPADGLAWAPDAGADDPDVVQIVVANDDAFGDDTFHIQTATLGVIKSSLVVADGLGSADPKAIPGATVEYSITIANTGSQDATLSSISDTMPTATTFRPDEYPGATDVSIQVDALPATYCTSTADADGCVLTGTTLTVGGPTLTTIVAGSTIVVRFRVTIN